jgi:hypothetical protein
MTTRSISELARDPEVRQMAAAGARHLLQVLAAEPTPQQTAALGFAVRKAGKRNLSPEARERIADAQRRRWKEHRKQQQQKSARRTARKGE